MSANISKQFLAALEDLLDRYTATIREETKAEVVAAISSNFSGLMTGKQKVGRPPSVKLAPALPHKISRAKRLNGRYVGMLNSAAGPVKEKAKELRQEKGAKAAIAYLEAQKGKPAKKAAIKAKAPKKAPVKAKPVKKVAVKAKPVKKAAVKAKPSKKAAVKAKAAAKPAAKKPAAKKNGVKDKGNHAAVKAKTGKKSTGKTKAKQTADRMIDTAAPPPA